MVIIKNNDNNQVLKGMLLCKCAKCGKQGAYEMSEAETKLYMEYQIKGRSMGPLQTIFPNIPAWILSGAIEPLSDGYCECPECNKK